MGGKKKEEAPHPVTRFTRLKLQEWKNSGRTFLEIAEIVGCAPSLISSIYTEANNVTLVTLPGLAEAFGYPSEPAYFAAAFAADGGRVDSGSPALAQQAEAIAFARSHGVTSAQIARVLERFPLVEYGHLDALSWLEKFHAERSDEVARAAATKAVAHRETHADLLADVKREQIRQESARKRAPVTRRSSRAKAS